MSSPADETLAEAADETLEEQAAGSEEEEDEAEQKVSDTENSEQSEEWETMARAWVSSFPEARAVSMDEVEAWIDSNFDLIPEGIKSMPRADVCQRLMAIQNCMRSANQEKQEDQGEISHARFQRTDQWRPVYIWLESLNRDDVVKSKDINEWLTCNPRIQEYLCSRHTRYHLMHYIKKCHMKILKRRERKKGVQPSDTPASLKVHNDVAMKQKAPLPCTTLVNVPQDSDLYMMKRKEALEKFQILVELEKLLAPTFLKRGDGNR
ncbi:uncharacterized protein LOC126793149 [Argentina anserina]|uniref:uncharacterized protein LOC126793149 n=1 Tax=Argentina anserina TaxID=57926 RepID=UPI002176667D|nr:uncharacterized protein LOC126793149 [Potentilla anserina]